MTRPRLFANHAHVFPKEVKENGTIDKLKELMEGCGIEKVVAFAPFSRGNQTQMRYPGEDQNVWLAEQIKNEPNIVGFGTVDFTKDNLAEQAEQIASLGLLGIKLHPAHQEFKVNGSKAFSLYEAAERLGLFLSFHTGVHYHRLSDYTMLLFDDISYSFPKLRYSMEHLGGYSFFREGVAVMSNSQRDRENPRVFAGWTSIYSPGQWYLTDEELCNLVLITRENAHIFGLDFPYTDVEKMNIAIDRIMHLPISDSAKEKILGGNLRRVLNID
ncbi:MAG TPA: amidohydrolase family protein [Clostridiales bacterium]|nr:amidohydrolase family protein [Clostridiales bacterium]